MPATEDLAAAIYARVSSEQQAQQQTIASQVEALRQRVRHDGLTLPEGLVVPKKKRPKRPKLPGATADIEQLMTALLPKRTMDKFIARRLGLVPPAR